jgi:SRSO17 transposase
VGRSRRRLATTARTGCSRWDADAVRDDLRGYVAEHLAADDGVLIVDETGFLKKGVKSAGVQRQYSGTAGRVENCQLGVFVAYASSKGRVLVDQELYLPERWCADLPRRAAAASTTTSRLRPSQRKRCGCSAAPSTVAYRPRWVTTDEAYGKDVKFRAWLQRRRVGYVLAVACNQRIPTQGGSARAARWRPGHRCRRGSGAVAATERKDHACMTGRWHRCRTPAPPSTATRAGC